MNGREMLSLAVLAVGILLAGFAFASQEAMEFTYSFADPVIQTDSQGTQVWIEGCRSVGYPGEPVLPVKPVRLLVPFGMDASSVKLSPGAPVEISIAAPVVHGAREYPLSYDGPYKPQEPKASIYNSERAYPENVIGKISRQNKMGYKILVLNLSPVEYVPAEGLLLFHRSIKVSLTLEDAKDLAQPLAVRDLTADRAEILRIVDNPEQMETYPERVDASGTTALDAKEPYQYVIITSDELAAASGSYSFQALADSKARYGMAGTVVTTTWIYANYTGQDEADQVRNFIIDAYNNWDTQYVLLGGDSDGSVVGGETEATVVPHRGFYAVGYGTPDSHIPADLYFSCLDGTFNYDGDGYWGESNDGPDGGEVDLYAEVFVGRAGADSVAEMENFVRKTFEYESYSPSESFMKSALMVGELLWSDPTYGGDYKDEVKDGSSNHGYTTVGFPEEWTVDTLYDRDVSGEWPLSQLIGYINADTYSVINHLGHSYVDYCMRMYNDDADALTNQKVFFGYSQGCYDGSFDNRNDYGSVMSSDSIAEHYTTQENGMFAFIGNSRYGWGQHSSTNGSSQYYDREFYDALFAEEIYEMGRTNQDSKEDTIPFLDYGANRWVYYELILFGDPQLKLGNPISSDGLFGMDRTVFGDGDEANLSLMDMDLDLNPNVAEQVTVAAQSDCGDTLDIVLTETGTATATFTGGFSVAEGSPNPGDQTLQCAHLDQIVVTYYDEYTGHGAEYKTVEGTSDFLAPVFSGIGGVVAGDASLVLSWDAASDDTPPVTYTVYRGSEPGGEDFENPVGSTVDLAFTDTGLENYRHYYYVVRASDPAGNAESNTEELMGYPVGPIPLFTEDWEVDDITDWEIQDVNEDGKSWTDTNPEGRSSLWWDGLFLIADAGWAVLKPMNEILTSPAIDAGFFTGLSLRFSHNFDDEDLLLNREKAYVYVGTGEDQWTEVALYEDSDSGQEIIELDASYDQTEDLRVRFHYENGRLFSDGYWGVDNIMVFGTPIEDPNPLAGFTVDATEGEAPFTVNFTDDSHGLIESRSWSFGDGGTSEDLNPSYTYEEPGTYTVSLQVSGPYGENEMVQEDLIQVNSAADDDDDTGDDDTDDDDDTGDDDTGDDDDDTGDDDDDDDDDDGCGC